MTMKIALGQPLHGDSVGPLLQGKGGGLRHCFPCKGSETTWASLHKSRFILKTESSADIKNEGSSYLQHQAPKHGKRGEELGWLVGAGRRQWGGEGIIDICNTINNNIHLKQHGKRKRARCRIHMACYHPRENVGVCIHS